jgi:hypothetical protein
MALAGSQRLMLMPIAPISPSRLAQLARLVPGSYQADPVQSVGGFVVVTFTAECDELGRPR